MWDRVPRRGGRRGSGIWKGGGRILLGGGGEEVRLGVWLSFGLVGFGWVGEGRGGEGRGRG